MKSYFVLIFISLAFVSNGLSQDHSQVNSKNKSLPYDEVIAAYQQLSSQGKTGKLFTEGLTDCGRPLHLFVISADGTFDPLEARKKDKVVILINNGIHPGEPDGIDASLQLARQYVSGQLKVPSNIVICIIPVFNIDGALRRGCCSRANQNGPEEYGFRGNARNLDLNRDFIKSDAENTRSFIKIFRKWDPHVFIDTHVSDGADYQYTMTLISTQHNKLGGPTGAFLKNKMTPALFAKMKESGDEMAPYVNTSRYDDTPENGIYGFLENPRFASGYTALFQCLGFVLETHMLKPFDSRVKSTERLLKIIVDYTAQNADEINTVRKKSREMIRSQKDFPISWVLDSSKFFTFPFKGYEAEQRTSKVTGLSQLYFNQQKPFTREIRMYDEYKPGASVTKPKYYVVPQAWKEVLQKMEMNNVVMSKLAADTTMEVETYMISDFKTTKEPYEGHYLHSKTEVTSERAKISYLKGDYLIPVDQDCNRFIVETLEPAATDSWFNWGFFDAILQQKEWFSAYVFDEMAEQLLNNDPELKKTFEAKKSNDKEFAADSFAQLYFLYRNSPNFEDLRRYPVGRVW